MGSIVSTGVGSGLDVAGHRAEARRGRRRAEDAAPRHRRSEGPGQAVGARHACVPRSRAFRDTLDDAEEHRQVPRSAGNAVEPDFLSATATSSAVPGSYPIEVEHLAQAHKLQSNPDFAADTTLVGTGTLRIVDRRQEFRRRHRRDATTRSRASRTRSTSSAAGAQGRSDVVTGAGAARLTITARTTGAANAITITQSGGDGGLAGIVHPPAGGGLTAGPSRARRAKRSSTVSPSPSATNTITGAIAGVDVTLLEVNEAGETTQLTIGYNRDACAQDDRRAREELQRRRRRHQERLELQRGDASKAGRCSATRACATSFRSCAASSRRTSRVSRGRSTCWASIGISRTARRQAQRRRADARRGIRGRFRRGRRAVRHERGRRRRRSSTRCLSRT